MRAYQFKYQRGLLETFYGVYEKDPDSFVSSPAHGCCTLLTGEDLLAIAADQPFRFPATFTFVVRAFSVLDGIGKGLDPRFDITEIAKP
ncbi:hypothetical protein SDJN02_27730 [Cucurbita argyrosperma subsp. argyrosperma]|nr:hypothetical protein SDJN02_27730 [Cucurbita argyrosperma subsp. argyrosperma]